MKCVVTLLLAATWAPSGVAAQIVGSESATVTQRIDGTNLSIEYSRPSLRGRLTGELFGGDIAYGRTWTPGANWATIFATDKDVEIDGVPVPAGRYSVWMYVDSTDWALILDPRDSLFHVVHPEATDDQIRLPVERKTAATSIETLTWSFPAIRSDGADLRLQWGTVQVDAKLTVEPTERTTVTAEEAAPYLGKWKVTVSTEMLPPGAEEDFVFEMELVHAAERITGEMDMGPAIGVMTIFFTPKAEGVFGMAQGMNGRMVGIIPGTLVEFDLADDGVPRGFDVRFNDDRIWMSATRVESGS